MNRQIVVSVFIILTLFFVPTLLSIDSVSAQSSGYTIQSVDHVVEVMFSGHIVLRDEIRISGSITNGFQLGIPSQYASAVLKIVAYDNNREYPVEVVNQLGGQSGFCVAQVNFEGQNPQFFTIAFVLSNDLVGKSVDGYSLDYPAYPAFSTRADRCRVVLSLPMEPSTISIFKTDGQVNSTTYYYQGSLPAYTNAPASALFDLPVGLLHLVDISELNRQSAIVPSGGMSCVDAYNIKNVDIFNLSSFMLNLPSDAKDIVVRDSSGSILSSRTIPAGSILIVNASLSSYVASGQSVQITAEYNLPGLTGNNRTVDIFPAVNYFVDTVTFTLTLPDGALVTTADPSAVITTNWYEQKLTVTRQGVTYVDYQVPGHVSLQINYNYNPLWPSFRPTFIIFTIAVICCFIISVWKKQDSKKTTAISKEKNRPLKNNKNKKRRQM
jgi:hypothetical protein